jgi:hypothetical protein
MEAERSIKNGAKAQRLNGKKIEKERGRMGEWEI